MFYPRFNSDGDWWMWVDTAMEATVFLDSSLSNFESRGIEVKLVNAHHVKTVPGRKTDVKDCQWLQQLHTAYCPVRSVLKTKCVFYVVISVSETASSKMPAPRMYSGCKPWFRWICIYINISDIWSTGMAIIKAIVAGETDPQVASSLERPPN